MSGRAAGEDHRASTPLELLYDLTVVVAISTAGSELASALAFGHVLSGVFSFAFCLFAVVWAWIGFTWFASGYDTDDWLMRMATLVQMIGVVVMALGIPAVFDGYAHGRLHNHVLVAGYVTMRLSAVLLYLRAARADRERRDRLRGFAAGTVLTQAAWVVIAFAPFPGSVTIAAALVALAAEFAVPLVLRRRGGLPWHPHHIAERYGLLLIISLGEIILGTTIAVQALLAAEGWSVEAVLIVAAGISIAVGIWWVYFGVRFGDALQAGPANGLAFSFLHIPIYAGIAGVGAGLRVSAYFVEHPAGLHIGLPGIALSLAAPMALATVALFAVVLRMLPGRDALHVTLGVTSVLALAGSVALAAVGTPLGISLLVLILVPWVSVVGYELRGHEHMDRVLAQLQGGA